LPETSEKDIDRSNEKMLPSNEKLLTNMQQENCQLNPPGTGGP